MMGLENRRWPFFRVGKSRTQGNKPCKSKFSRAKMTFLRKLADAYHHHFSFSGSVSPKSWAPDMLLACPLRLPLLTRLSLGCLCCVVLEELATVVAEAAAAATDEDDKLDMG